MKKSYRLACILLSAALLFPACASAGKETESTAGTPDSPSAAVAVLSGYGYTYQNDITPYAMSITSQSLLLANKTVILGDDYTPTDLVTINPSLTLYGRAQSLSADAANAATALILEMRAIGYTGISMTSSYRSYKRQEELFSIYKQNEKKAHPAWTDAQVEERVLSYSARPGTSEHQTGLCMDLFYTGMTELVNYGYETETEGDLGFAETGAYRWLTENAHRFGFILRYPQDKTGVTGYSYESWHYRFVGVKAATEIHNAGITLEEYLANH